MWTSYSARHASQLIGLPESAIRSCIRDGLVGTPGTVPAQLTFRDLSALRTVKALVDAGLPHRKSWFGGRHQRIYTGNRRGWK